MLIGEAVLPQAGEARTFLRIGSVSDDRRHLELELLLQRTIPGKLVSADEPSLLQELEEMVSRAEDEDERVRLQALADLVREL